MRVWKRTYAYTIRITYAYTYHTHKKGRIENATLKCSKISYFLFQTQNLIFFLYNFLLEIFVFFSRYKSRKSLQIHTCPRTSQTDVWWWEIQARSLGGQREASRCVYVCVLCCVSLASVQAQITFVLHKSTRITWIFPCEQFRECHSRVLVFPFLWVFVCGCFCGCVCVFRWLSVTPISTPMSSCSSSEGNFYNIEETKKEKT